MDDTEWNTDDWDGCDWADYLMTYETNQEDEVPMWYTDD